MILRNIVIFLDDGQWFAGRFVGMNTWAPLWNGIVDSSIWDEPDYVVKVFMTMLALKDADHVVRLNAYQLSKRARKTEQEVLDALKVLASPDTKRLEQQPFDGRRIQAVEDGFLVLNGEKYRALVREEMRKAKNRRAAKAYRDRKALRNVPTATEAAIDKAARSGDEETVQRLMNQAG